MIVRFILILLFVSTCIVQSSAQYRMKNFNVEDGLPSSQVYNSVVDKNGYTWFATDRGIVKFNGHTFKVFDDLTSSVFLRVAPHPVDGVFAYNLDKKLYHVTSEGSFITILEDINELTLNDIRADKEGRVIVNFDEKSYWISKHGTRKTEVDCRTSANKMTSYLEVGGDLVEVSLHRISKGTFEFTQKKRTDRIHKHPDDIHGSNFLLGLISEQSPSPLNLCFTRGFIFSLRDKKIIYSAEEIKGIQWAQGINDSLVLIGLRKNKLILHNLNSKKSETVIDNCTVSSMRIDGENNVWVTTLWKGVYVISLNEQMIPFSAARIYSMDIMNEKLFIGASDNKVYTLKDGEFDVFKDVTGDPRTHSVNDSVVFISGKPSYLVANGNALRIDGMQPVNNVYGFENEIITVSFIRCQKYEWDETGFVMKEEIHFDEYIECCYFDKNVELYGSRNGLFIKHRSGTNGSMDHILKGVRIIDIEKHNGRYILSTRGHGIYILNEQFGILQNLTLNDDLLSNQILLSEIHKGWLWIVTPKGVQLIDLANKDLKVNTIFNLNGEGEVRSLCFGKELLAVALLDKVYIASLEKFLNLNYLRNKRHFFSGGWKQLGSSKEIKNLISLDHESNDLSFSWDFVSSPFKGEPIFRYRLKEKNSDANWRRTTDLNAAFYNLQPGAYSFELQWQNDDGNWTRVYRKSLQIIPPWWQRTYAQLLFFLLGATVAFGVGYLLLIRRVKRKRLQLEIASLKNKALRSQMNPHFIFNTLNSIQRYISENDSYSASIHLARFAQLVRKILTNSDKSMVSLREEVELIKQYVEIEKSRFKEKLSTSINIDSSVNLDLLIPAFSIQPIVENAIKHGIAKSEDHGELLIELKSEPDRIVCIVENTGPKNTEKIEDLIQKNTTSFGLRGVHQRLQLIDKQFGVEILERDKYKTTIRISLPEIEENESSNN